MMSLIGRIISSIGVPLFWMISGALLLPKKEPWKKIYRKRILRIASVLFLFSLIRYFYLCIAEGLTGSVGEFFQSFYTQKIFLPYWFLYEYMGMLFVLPFLRKMMQNLTEQEKRLLFILLLGWHVLNDISNMFLGTDFVLDLHFQSSLSYFMLGYLMEDCQFLKRNERRGLKISIGWAVFVTVFLYVWVRSQHGLESLESLIMLLTISAYYIIRYIGKGIGNNAVVHRIVLWCGSNVFGIYLMEDYLRNITAVIWERLSPYITVIPACCVWLLVVFLLGNILVSGVRRLPILRDLL